VPQARGSFVSVLGANASGAAPTALSSSAKIGWIKTVAGQEKTKFRGRDRVGWAFTFAAAAYNLVRLPKLMAVPA
jgi:hypothetical protein